MGSQDHPGARPMERARLTAGVTIPEAAVATGRSTATIRRYETGQTTPPQAVFITMARLYGVDPAALVGDA